MAYEQGGLWVPPQGQAGPTAGGAVPYWLKPGVQIPHLVELLRRMPQLADQLPQNILDQFPNEAFVADPKLAQRASSGRQEQFYTDNPQYRPGNRATPEPDVKRGLVPGIGMVGITAPAGGGAPAGAPPPLTPGTAPWQDNRSAAGGDKTGYLVGGGPSGVQLSEDGKQTPLAPRLAAPITGAQQPLYRTSGGLPMYSAQALARMTAGERDIVGTTVNKTGGSARDYFEEQRKRFSAPRTQPGRYSRGR